MPHKFNAARRHKFDKAQYRVINWAEYNESLRQRGDLTIWVSEEGRFFRQLLLSSDGSPRWRRIGSLSKQTKGMPPDL